MAIVSASRCAAETEQGPHVFEITGYSLHRGLGVGRFLRSATFAVGGHDWSVLLYPDGVDEHRSDCISVGVELMSANRAAAVPVRATSSLCFFHRVTRMFSWSSPPVKFNFVHPTSWRYCFCSIRMSLLERSGYAAGDRVMIKCVVAVVKDPRTIPPGGTQVPPSDIKEHLRSLLESKESTDVTFEFGGEEFPAHRLVLAMCSPVFKAELCGLQTSESRIVVGDMRPPVFRALLHFIYTDSLPPMHDHPGGDAMNEIIKDLLAAADRYTMERLELVCESILCKGIDTKSVAATLVLADRHNCIGLKDACIQFIASLGKTDDVVARQGYAMLARVLKKKKARLRSAQKNLSSCFSRNVGET